MARLTHLPATDPVTAVTEVLTEEGAVVVDGLLEPGVLERFNADLDPLLAAAAPGHDGVFVNESVAAFFGPGVRHVSGLAGRSRVFAHEVMTTPALLDVADAVLAPMCSQVILNLGHVLARGPGTEPQILHRDRAVWPHLPRALGEIQVASMIALSPFTRENGATLVVPGSHRWEDDRRPEPDEIAYAEMPAGSAVVYLGSTLHAGGGNATDATWRRGVHMSYCAGWLRTEENAYLCVTLDQVRDMPERAQVLLGFDAHDAIAIGGGYLGTVELASPLRTVLPRA